MVGGHSRGRRAGRSRLSHSLSSLGPLPASSSPLPCKQCQRGLKGALARPACVDHHHRLPFVQRAGSQATRQSICLQVTVVAVLTFCAALQVGPVQLTRPRRLHEVSRGRLRPQQPATADVASARRSRLLRRDTASASRRQLHSKVSRTATSAESRYPPAAEKTAIEPGDCRAARRRAPHARRQ